LPKLFRWLFAEDKRRSKGRRASRLRSNLVRVGRQLLAHQDFDQLSVSTITSRARCSVGAFYTRFPHKSIFLDQVIVDTFDVASEAAKTDLAPERWRNAASGRVVRAITEHVVKTMNDETAGVMRAALKRAQAVPAALDPILSYRSVTTDLAVALLAQRVPPELRRKNAVRIALQILHATVMDSLLQDQGPLHGGTRIMVDELSGIVAQHLKLPVAGRGHR
jgi:AcrR family transcriptional regulator